MTIWETFLAHDGRLIDKWRHYFDIYERHFKRYQGRPVSILEIGVNHGGSLQLWKSYFGPLANVYGLDIDPRCKDYEEPRIYIDIGDQQVWTPPVRHNWPLAFDIIVDDGSHVLQHQAMSFEHLWPCCRDLYLIEDCHNGYPQLTGAGKAYIHQYPQVLVLERFKRLIKGHPSRGLRADEISANAKHGE